MQSFIVVDTVVAEMRKLFIVTFIDLSHQSDKHSIMHIFLAHISDNFSFFFL